MITRLIALIILIIISPFLGLLWILIKVLSPGPFIFYQQRLGKDKKPFFIYKIRTMIKDAEAKKTKIRQLNEADGPVFKIFNDPRYTPIGRFLAHTGLDELLQLVNIIKGQMTFVGPRPLPINEAKKIPKNYHRRFSVLPGLTSIWVVKGSYHHSFTQWMQDDIDYVDRKNIFFDLKLIILTIMVVAKYLLINLFFNKSQKSSSKQKSIKI